MSLRQCLKARTDVFNSIALLSNFERPGIDLPSPNWLGLQSDKCTIRESGLWNTNHVEKSHDPMFLEKLGAFVAGTLLDTHAGRTLGWPKRRLAPTNRLTRPELNQWSALKAKLAFSFSFGPCTQVFVSEMHMDRLDRICFQGVCLDGNGSFLTVDIRQYDQMEVGEVEVPALAGRPALARRTEVTLSDCAMGTSLEISDAPMNFTQVLHRIASGTA